MSLVVLAGFVLPSILSGHPPLAVAITGSTLVMLLALYLAHGLNVRTTSAVLGTFVSLTLVALLALVFVRVTRLTGLASEDALFVHVAAGRINLEGLLLAGIVIGSLGVLDDVTVIQASAVWELHLANPALEASGLYRAALRIGRDHIASTVNTLSSPTRARRFRSSSCSRCRAPTSATSSTGRSSPRRWSARSSAASASLPRSP